VENKAWYEKNTPEQRNPYFNIFNRVGIHVAKFEVNEECMELAQQAAEMMVSLLNKE